MTMIYFVAGSMVGEVGWSNLLLPAMKNNVSSVTRIRHESHFSCQAQYLVGLDGHTCCSTQYKYDASYHLCQTSDCDFSWQAQPLVMLECHFLWQVQHFSIQNRWPRGKSKLCERTGSVWSDHFRIMLECSAIVTDASTVFGKFLLDFGMRFFVAGAIFRDGGG